LDSDHAADDRDQPDFTRLLPFAVLHLGCLAAFWVGVTPVAVIVALALYWVRMFAITAFYHRYFSHRSYQTNRVCQFLFALLGLTAVQRGPLWWASHHRQHHRASDEPADPHSPKQLGFFMAHMGWLLVPKNLQTDYNRVRDLAQFPELVFLNRFDWLGAVLLLAVLYAGGEACRVWQPGWGTHGLQLMVWGGFISTTVLFHGTCTINSLSHTWGKRRYNTTDTSRNNLWLSLITLGEGWHNNHHQYPGTVRQGFFWWEVDITYYVLKVMAALGLVYKLNPVPSGAYQGAQQA
jgi:stearoyl-CoA desaturase (delta-9 desaturase)